jgi:hypothetical protein
MSQSFNSTQNYFKISPSMMTFKEYCKYFLEIKEPHSTNGWGWFIDIESNSEQIKISSYRYQKTSKYVSIPKTIQEYPSIRSMKSMKNLHDTSMIFEMDDDIKHRTNTNINIMAHSIGIIGVLLCYYLICIKF